MYENLCVNMSISDGRPPTGPIVEAHANSKEAYDKCKVKHRESNCGQPTGTAHAALVDDEEAVLVKVLPEIHFEREKVSFCVFTNI